MTEFKCPSCGATLTVAAKRTQHLKSLEDVKALFPKHLEEMLLFEQKEHHIVIRPRQYLDSENFAKVAAIVREAGGKYISQGKQSHFQLPK